MYVSKYDILKIPGEDRERHERKTDNNSNKCGQYLCTYQQGNKKT